MADRREQRGLSARSIAACLFAMVATALCVQFFEIIEASGNGFGRTALPIASMMVFVPLLLIVAGVSWLARFRFLSKPELMAVLFCSIMTAPLASNGFWMMLIGPLGTIPKTAYFEVYDALPPSLWPHSKNVLVDSLKSGDDAITARRGHVAWEEVATAEGDFGTIPVLENGDSGQTSSFRVRVPLATAQDTFDTALVLEEPYLLSVLLRPVDLGPDAEYFCHIYTGGKEEFDVEVFAGRTSGEKNFLHPDGFLRRGIYGLSLPPGTESPIEIEIGLSGRGRLEIADCELLSVGALDAIYRGRTLITAEDRAALPEGPLPHRLIPRADNPLSAEGLAGFVAGSIPWNHWWRPFLSWYSFGALVLLGLMALAALFHRQWIENERYPLPNTAIPVAIVGQPDDESFVLSSVWRNPAMWLGFALALFWCLMKGWNAYNPAVPDMNLRIDLSPYFTDPAWGKTWRGEEARNVTFHVTAIMLSIAIFMELNVLFSLVLGFALFRLQYFVGEMTGMAQQQDYPYFREQQIGAFLIYGALIILFTRRHLWSTLVGAFTGVRSGSSQAGLGYRTAWTLLLACFIAMLAWAYCNGIAPLGIVIFYVFILLVGLVAMKLRAECGIVTGWFGPIAVAGIIPLTGGMLLYGTHGVIFVCIAAYALFQYLFFMTAGMQMEMMEMGRRYRMPRRDVVGILLLGTVGALFLSGWVHLTLGFGVGGDNYQERWPYMDKTFIVHDYNLAIADANLLLLPEDAPERAAAGGFKPMHAGYIVGGGITLLLTILRQAFSGFWFHPIGFIVGSSPMMEIAWGSILAAAVIRTITFRVGGSRAVRTKLMPFFVGVFLGAIAAYLVFAGISAWLHFYHPEVFRRSIGPLF